MSSISLMGYQSQYLIKITLTQLQHSNQKQCGVIFINLRKYLTLSCNLNLKRSQTDFFCGESKRIEFNQNFFFSLFFTDACASPVILEKIVIQNIFPVHRHHVKMEEPANNQQLYHTNANVHQVRN